MTPEEFKTIRLSLALTQAELARLLGLGLPRSILRYENGTRAISSTIARMMRLIRDVPQVFDYLDKLPDDEPAKGDIPAPKPDRKLAR